MVVFVWGGEQLLQSELAKQFGVNRGLFVAESGLYDVFDIYTARTAVERAACLKLIDVTNPVDQRIAEHRRIAEAIRDREVLSLHRLLAKHMDHALE